MANNVELKRIMGNLSEDLRQLLSERAKIDEEINTIIPILSKVNQKIEEEE
ncbi:MAG: hypothetical protein O8C67_04880 [Candidatus Methanoperedens sp.]|nr:hypothetical protein [Candidatus Methanoperedens sp.]